MLAMTSFRYNGGYVFFLFFMGESGNFILFSPFLCVYGKKSLLFSIAWSLSKLSDQAT